MKRVLVVLALAAIGAAYFVGYWPERQARVASERTLEAMRANLERAEARNRLYGLQSKLSDLLGTVEARNFGEAQGKATAFFDAVRAEASRSDQAGATKALEGILEGRDSLTIAITQNDPAALEMLRGAMTRVRAALGETPPHEAAGPSPSPAAPATKGNGGR
jgi:uncharacterized protein (DUF2267 family)